MLALTIPKSESFRGGQAFLPMTVTLDPVLEHQIGSCNINENIR